MSARWLAGFLVAVLIAFLATVALLMTGALEAAWSQEPRAGGSERLSPDERAVVERNLERWKQLSPEERQRALENYRQWKAMSPAERQTVRENFQRFRQMPPQAKARVLDEL